MSAVERESWIYPACQKKTTRVAKTAEAHRCDKQYLTQTTSTTSESARSLKRQRVGDSHPSSHLQLPQDDSTKLDYLIQCVIKLTETNESLLQEVSALKKENSELKLAMRKMQDYTRRNNLVPSWYFSARWYVWVYKYSTAGSAKGWCQHLRNGC